MKMISSPSTLWWKWLFSISWILIGGTIFSMAFAGYLQAGDRPLPSLWIKSMAAAAWVIASASLIRECSRLKRVRIDVRSIHVSNGLREITLPFDAIESVEQNVAHKQRLVTIRLRRATVFGKRIDFVPTSQPTTWTPYPFHPIVLELQTLAGLAGQD